MSITEQQSLIMHTLLWVALGASLGVAIITIMYLRRNWKIKDEVKKDINRTFEFL